MRRGMKVSALDLAALLVATALCAKAQEESGPCWPQRGDPTREAAVTLDRALRDAGYTAAGSSRLSALQDPKWQVKGVAAARLAMAEGPTAIPTLLAAWAEEKDRCGKEGMRLALASLGKPVYVQTLAHRGGRNLAPPFQVCKPSEPPVLSLRIESVHQTPGSPPLVRVMLRNESRQPLALLRIALSESTFSAAVLDPTGKHAPVAKLWAYGPELASLALTYDSPELAPLMPNEEISETWKPSGSFEMTAPGTYRVSLGGTIDYLNTTVCSNVLEVVVR